MKAKLGSGKRFAAIEKKAEKFYESKELLAARGTTCKPQSRDFQSTSHCWEYAEHRCWDPKDGELCLARLKPGETLVEDRSDSDVQIDRRSWV